MACRQAAPTPGTPDTSEWLVPPGRVFVLGDNRSHSKDDRDFGTVPMADVMGKARQVWFSHGPEGFRWSRFGLVVSH